MFTDVALGDLCMNSGGHAVPGRSSNHFKSLSSSITLFSQVIDFFPQQMYIACVRILQLRTFRRVCSNRFDTSQAFSVNTKSKFSDLATSTSTIVQASGRRN